MPCSYTRIAQETFFTYIKFRGGKPWYVGEGSLFRTFRNTREGWPKDNNYDTVITSAHGDKAASMLNEQGLISWIGIDNLHNKIPFQLFSANRMREINLSRKGKPRSPQVVEKIRAAALLREAKKREARDKQTTDLRRTGGTAREAES